jgi:hypothetical protein
MNVNLNMFKENLSLLLARIPSKNLNMTKTNLENEKLTKQ